jgi:hypothetical protein
MFEPFIYISTHRIKEGKIEATKVWNREFVKLVEAKEPRLIASHLYLNESQSEGTIVLIHPDADSMDFHLRVAGDLIGEGLALAPTGSIQVYGTPSPMLQEVLRRNAESGVPVSITTHHLGGFTRCA